MPRKPRKSADPVRAEMNANRPPTAAALTDVRQEVMRRTGPLPTVRVHLITGEMREATSGEWEEIQEIFPGIPSPYVMTNLTPDVRQAIVDKVRKGAFLDVACAHVGVQPLTVKKFLAHAENYPGTVFSSLALDLAEAEADAECIMVDRVFKAAEKEQYWTAAAWWLERTKSDKYAQKAIVKHQVEREVQELMRHLERHLPPDIFKQVVAAILTGNTRLETEDVGTVEVQAVLQLPDTTG